KRRVGARRDGDGEEREEYGFHGRKAATRRNGRPLHHTRLRRALPCRVCGSACISCQTGRANGRRSRAAAKTSARSARWGSANPPGKIAGKTAPRPDGG